MSNSKPKTQLMVLFLSVVIYLIGFGIVIPMIPSLSRDFGATPFEVGLVMTVYSAMQFLLAPFWGGLSDRYGRRPIILGSLLGEAFSYILFAWSSSLWFFIFVRMIAGFFGANLSTASAYISDITTERDRSKGMALIGAAFGLGFSIGPTIGGILLVWSEHNHHSPRESVQVIGYAVACLCFANFLFGLKYLKESRDFSKAPMQPRSRFQVLKAAFSRPTLNTLLGVMFLSTFAMASMEPTIVLLVQDRWQWSMRHIAFGFAYIGVMMILTQGFIVRPLLARLGERKVLCIGLVSLALGFFGVAVAFNLSLLVVAITIIAMGSGFVNPSVLGSVSLITDSDSQGRNLGVAQSMSALGRIVGPVVGGAVYQAIAPSASFFAAGILAALGLLVVLLKYGDLPEKANQPKSMNVELKQV